MDMDVDTALSEVPVNLVPLLDDTDFKTIEESVAYNAAGLELIWHFTTTAGATTATVVTPTTGGSYDWAHQDGGMYTIEIPASGGASINNDTEGFGYFTGKANGVLPWRGPTIRFRAAALNDLLTDSAYSTTRGLAGTALPNAAADAAGGLVISDAGGFDIDNRAPSAASIGNMNIVFNTDFAANYNTTLDGWNVNTTHAAGTAWASGAITAAAIAASALNGKGDWNIGKTGYALTSAGLDLITAWTVNITGNLTGSVGSVTGAVGSVTGNVGGNVVGSVGSISGITFPTNFSTILITSDGYISRVVLNDTTTTNSDMRGTDNAATAANLATAQADLDILTGADGATLASSQPNYAPAKVSDLGTVQTADHTAAIAAIQADLPIRFTKNVAYSTDFSFLMVDSSGDPATGLTVAGQISKDGGSFASLTNAITEIASGWYKIAGFTQTEMNANMIALRFTATGAKTRNIAFVTQPT